MLWLEGFCVLQTAVGSLQWAASDTEWLISVMLWLEGFCVLQTAVGSLQWTDFNTEWLIGINVVTGGVLSASDSSCFFTVSWFWYWVANWYKCCDWRGLVCCRQQLVLYCELIAILRANWYKCCDWRGFVCCRQQLDLYSELIVILSG